MLKIYQGIIINVAHYLCEMFLLFKLSAQTLVVSDTSPSSLARLLTERSTNPILKQIRRKIQLTLRNFPHSDCFQPKSSRLRRESNRKINIQDEMAPTYTQLLRAPS